MAIKNFNNTKNVNFSSNSSNNNIYAHIQNSIGNASNSVNSAEEVDFVNVVSSSSLIDKFISSIFNSNGSFSIDKGINVFSWKNLDNTIPFAQLNIKTILAGISKASDYDNDQLMGLGGVTLDVDGSELHFRKRIIAADGSVSYYDKDGQCIKYVDPNGNMNINGVSYVIKKATNPGENSKLFITYRDGSSAVREWNNSSMIRKPGDVDTLSCYDKGGVLVDTYDYSSFGFTSQTDPIIFGSFNSIYGLFNGKVTNPKYDDTLRNLTSDINGQMIPYSKRIKGSNGVITYYDKRGNIIKKIDPNGTVTINGVQYTMIKKNPQYGSVESMGYGNDLNRLGGEYSEYIFQAVYPDGSFSIRTWVDDGSGARLGDKLSIVDSNGTVICNQNISDRGMNDMHKIN